MNTTPKPATAKLIVTFAALLFVFSFTATAQQEDNKSAVNTMQTGNIVPADQMPKYALVIGNADYTNMKVLDSPVLDARAMRDVLKTLDVTVFYYENLTLPQMEQAVRDFESRLEKECWAIFYFSGHGAEYTDPDTRTTSNYLLPVEFGRNIPGNEYQYKAYAADWVINKMSEKVTRGPQIAILDACRDNPGKGGPKGLSAMAANGDIIIAFAAAPSQVAKDGGPGKLSRYTEKLVEELKKNPDKVINQLFFDVQKEVSAATSYEQNPWINIGLRADYYLKPAKTGQQDSAESPDIPEAEVPTYILPEHLRPIVGTEPKMLFVQGGKFIMGCTPEQEPCFEWSVTSEPYIIEVSSFLIGETEVTNLQYCLFLNEYLLNLDVWKQNYAVLPLSNRANLSMQNLEKIGNIGKYIVLSKGKPQIEFSQNAEFVPKKGFENHPTSVTWNGAKAYCNWLSKKNGKNYNLPAEAQWEFAARGGLLAKKQTTYAGSNYYDSVAWFGPNSNGSTHPVGMKKPNSLGIFDMSGNQSEWCLDIWDRDYFKNNTQAKDPCINSTEVPFTTHPFRGGGYWRFPWAESMNVNVLSISHRSAFDLTGEKKEDQVHTGFRVVVIP